VSFSAPHSAGGFNHLLEFFDHRMELQKARNRIFGMNVIF
jgi:hypothetical protein